MDFGLRKCGALDMVMGDKTEEIQEMDNLSSGEAADLDDQAQLDWELVNTNKKKQVKKRPFASYKAKLKT